jgi:hypothetical protein
MKQYYKSTARNSKVFTKDVQNAACQNHYTSDIYAALIDVLSPTILELSAQLKSTYDSCDYFLCCLY